MKSRRLAWILLGVAFALYLTSVIIKLTGGESLRWTDATGLVVLGAVASSLVAARKRKP